MYFLAKRVLIFNMAEKEMQEVYEEFVLGYLSIHPECHQLDAINDIRKAFWLNDMGDPGIPVLRATIESLIKKGKIKGDEDSPLSRLSLAG